MLPQPESMLHHSSIPILYSNPALCPLCGEKIPAFVGRRIFYDEILKVAR
jgi:hypothetical protein